MKHGTITVKLDENKTYIYNHFRPKKGSAMISSNKRRFHIYNLGNDNLILSANIFWIQMD